jgi:hypothetical protein
MADLRRSATLRERPLGGRRLRRQGGVMESTVEWCAHLRPRLAEEARRNQEARCVLDLLWYLRFARHAQNDRPLWWGRPALGSNFCGRYVLAEARRLSAPGSPGGLGDPWQRQLTDLMREAAAVIAT